MLSCSPPADMETCFISRPTHAGAMSRRPIALSKEARSLRIRPSRRFIPPASRSVANINQSSRSCPNRSGMMDACGFRNVRKIATRRPVKFPRRIAITISSENIRATGIFRRAISPRAQQKKFATKAAVWVRADAAFISTLPTPLSAWVNIRFASAMEICSRFMKRSPAKTPTKCRCGFIRLFTTRWAVSGWIMT